MSTKTPRLAVRAIIVHEERLLLVNAWPNGRSDLLCAPGGGVDRGSALPDNLVREVYEETGLSVDVGAACLVNEFHDPRSGFHQVEVFFRCVIRGATHIDPNWKDIDNSVTEHHWLTEAQVARAKVKPDSLARIAFSTADFEFSYDPLETVVM